MIQAWYIYHKTPRSAPYAKLLLTEQDEVMMMCWENSEGSLVEEPNNETHNHDGRADDNMQKPKDEEEHANSTLHTGK